MLIHLCAKVKAWKFHYQIFNNLFNTKFCCTLIFLPSYYLVLLSNEVYLKDNKKLTFNYA